MSDAERIVEIEAFRVGPASRGITEKQLDEAIASYKAESAPLVFGHPKSDDPAHGWIATVRRDGAKLITGLKSISKDAIDGVKARKFANRSIAFWHPDHSANPTPGKWNIRHLGLLGAASPGIPNMPALTFSADEASIESTEAPDTAVIFTEAADEPTRTVIISEKGDKVPDPANQGDVIPKAEFDAAVAERDALKAKVEAAEAKAETDRKAANAKFVADQIEAGRVTPGEKVLFTEILNALPVAEVQFDAERKGDLASELKRVLSSAEPRIIFEALSPTGERGAKQEDPQAISDKAVAFQAEQSKLGRTIPIAEAVQHVMKGA